MDVIGGRGRDRFLTVRSGNIPVDYDQFYGVRSEDFVPNEIFYNTTCGPSG